MQPFRTALLLLATPALLAACGPADDVEVQPLPPLAALSPEARAGVPTVRGTWRFAGWEVAAGDSAALREPLPGFGALFLNGQKRDSVGGSYVVNGRRAPLAGEVRRDGTLALVTFLAPGDGRYLVGTFREDTVWLEMASLLEPGRWPDGARAAFVQSAVAEPFRRMRGALSARARADSIRAAALRADSIRADSLAAAAAAASAAANRENGASWGNGGAAPGVTAPGGVVPPPPPPVTRPPVSEPSPSQRPSVPAQAPRDSGARPTERPVVPTPEPRPEDTVTAPPPAAPPLLGVPVPTDTAGAGPGTTSPG